MKGTARDGRWRRLIFNEEGWTHGGLRYFVIGIDDPNDICRLSELLKMAARP